MLDRILTNLVRKEKEKVLRDEVRQKCASDLGKSFNIRRFGEAMRTVFPDVKCNNAGRTSADTPLVYSYYGVAYKDEEDTFNISPNFVHAYRAVGDDEDSLLEMRNSRSHELAASISSAVNTSGFSGLLPSSISQPLVQNVAPTISTDIRKAQLKRRLADSGDNSGDITFVSSSVEVADQTQSALLSQHHPVLKEVKLEKSAECFYCSMKDQEIEALKTLIDRQNNEIHKRDTIIESLQRECLSKEKEISEVKEKLGELQKKVEIVQRVLSI